MKVDENAYSTITVGSYATQNSNDLPRALSESRAASGGLVASRRSYLRWS